MRSVYLDTNVISGLAKGEYPEKVATALLEVTALAKNGQIELYTSDVTAEELELIPPGYGRQHFVIYNLIRNIARAPERRQFHHVIGGIGAIVRWTRLPSGNAQLYKELDALIPAEKNHQKSNARRRDIAHLYRFKQSGLDLFLTEDHKSILRYKASLLALGIRVASSLDLIAWKE